MKEKKTEKIQLSQPFIRKFPFCVQSPPIADSYLACFSSFGILDQVCTSNIQTRK
jgi:hypothetical protein